MDGWVGGWMEGKTRLRIAYSNQKFHLLGKVYFKIIDKMGKRPPEMHHYSENPFQEIDLYLLSIALVEIKLQIFEQIFFSVPLCLQSQQLTSPVIGATIR